MGGFSIFHLVTLLAVVAGLVLVLRRAPIRHDPMAATDTLLSRQLSRAASRHRLNWNAGPVAAAAALLFVTAAVQSLSFQFLLLSQSNYTAGSILVGGARWPGMILGAGIAAFATDRFRFRPGLVAVVLTLLACVAPLLLSLTHETFLMGVIAMLLRAATFAVALLVVAWLGYQGAADARSLTIVGLAEVLAQTGAQMGRLYLLDLSPSLSAIAQVVGSVGITVCVMAWPSAQRSPSGAGSDPQKTLPAFVLNPVTLQLLAGAFLGTAAVQVLEIAGFRFRELHPSALPLDLRPLGYPLGALASLAVTWRPSRDESGRSLSLVTAAMVAAAILLGISALIPPSTASYVGPIGAGVLSGLVYGPVAAIFQARADPDGRVVAAAVASVVAILGTSASYFTLQAQAADPAAAAGGVNALFAGAALVAALLLISTRSRIARR